MQACRFFYFKFQLFYTNESKGHNEWGHGVLNAFLESSADS